MKSSLNPQRHILRCNNKCTLTPDEIVCSSGPRTTIFSEHWQSTSLYRLYSFQTWQLILSNPPCYHLGFLVKALGCVPVSAPGEVTYYSGLGPTTNDDDLCRAENNLISSISLTCRLDRGEIKPITPVEKLISSRLWLLWSGWHALSRKIMESLTSTWSVYIA